VHQFNRQVLKFSLECQKNLKSLRMSIFPTLEEYDRLHTYGITAASEISGWDRSKCSNSAGGTCKLSFKWSEIDDKSNNIYIYIYIYMFVRKEGLGNHLISFVFDQFL
jgi:hypothetical protein